ncbi:hypothetical protein [Streptacidiphilus sp. EB103A]|uniref:hypothetical protein n=1 Tax=Streptacidiphilus sp. EB103A TaxID=3156275 RepID=UPI0035191E24
MLRLRKTRRTITIAAAALALAGGATIGLGGTANASSTYYFGGDTVTQNCHAWIVSNGNSWNWADGIVEGDANCQVILEATNVNTGGVQFTQWSSGLTTPLYHNDGVHKLRVWVYDGTSGAEGPGAWVN